MAKKRLVPLSVKGADLELTQKQKQKYDLARQKNDYIGMRLANVEANKLREKANLPLYSSEVGDKQHSLNTAKKVGNLKPYLGAQHIAPKLPRKKQSVSEQMFDKEETYADKAKKGDLKGAALNFVGSGIQGAQSFYLNTLNNADSIITGKGLQPFKYNMDFTDYENASAKRHNTKTVTEVISENHPKLGATYNIGMNIATDPVNLLDAAGILKAKGLKTLGSADYSKDLLKGGKTFIPTVKKETTQVLGANGKLKNIKTIKPVNSTSGFLGQVGDKFEVSRPLTTKPIPQAPNQAIQPQIQEKQLNNSKFFRLDNGVADVSGHIPTDGRMPFIDQIYYSSKLTDDVTDVANIPSEYLGKGNVTKAVENVIDYLKQNNQDKFQVQIMNEHSKNLMDRLVKQGKVKQLTDYRFDGDDVIYAITKPPNQAIQPQNLDLGTKLSQVEKTTPKLPYNPFANPKFKDLGANLPKPQAMAQKGVLPPMPDNYLKPVSEYTNILYHETDPRNALKFIDKNVMSDMQSDIYFANNKDMALGQGSNKGVVVELEPNANIQGKINTSKPTWQMEYANNKAEIIGRFNKQSDYINSVKSITIKPNASMTNGEKARLNNALTEWRKIKNADGSTTYVKPQPLQASISRGLPLNPKFKDLGADVNRFEEKAMALTNSEVLKPPKREILSDITANAKRKFVDAGDTVAKISKINNDDGLYSLYNNARNARKRADHHIGKMQTDINGDPVGKSLKAIFEPIRKQGDNYYEDFQEYMYHLHNVDRMAQNKPVFGDFVTADESQLVAESLLKQHPEFAEYAQEVRGYLDNLMKYRVDAGLVSEDSANVMAEMYKNYVPTYRANPSARGLNVFGNTARVNQGIKRAIGSNKDLLPLHEQISKQTMQTIDASHKNLFGARLVKNINPKTSQYIQELKKIDDAVDIDEDVLPEFKNKFTVYDKGTPYQMSVDSGLYEGIKALSGKEPDKIIELATKANTGFKELITSWNPMFLTRNFARDIQDVGLYTKNGKEFIKMYPSAVKEIATNGKMWQKYQALGGAGNSFFDYAKGYKKDPNWLRKNTLDRIESVNMGVEQAPRLAEFMSTISKLGHEPSYDELMQAMYNSADVTVNFGRSGTWGKTLNSTFVPFFNPAIQGTSKLIRRFTETKGSKEWTELVLKTVAFGVAPSLVNEMIYYNDPEYAKLQDGIKDTNFMFKLGDGEWLKIPKGRVLSLFGATAQRAYGDIKGEEDAYAGLVNTAKQQSAPINPFEANIVSPFRLAKNNQTWYGGEIEPQRVANMRPSQRYTESTTELSKNVVGAMGKVADKTGFSPMKLDYILDAYSGVIGDVAIPLMTPKAETNPFKKAFITDSVMQNRISNDFYNAKQEIIYNRNDETATLADDVLNRYMNRVQSNLSDRYKEIREIQNGLGTDKYKREKVRNKQKEVNKVQLEALSKLKAIKGSAGRLSSSTDDLDTLTREVNKDVFGSEYALKAYNKKIYEKAQWAKENGVDYDTFYDTYFMAKANNEDGKGAIKYREAVQVMKHLEVAPKEKQKMIQALFLSEKEREKIPKQ